MRAGLRFRTILVAGGLWLVPAIALAQNTTEPPPATTPTNDTIGPRELQNFSLPGTATRPANPASAATTASAPSTTTDAGPPQTGTEAQVVTPRPQTRQVERGTPSVARRPVVAPPPAPTNAALPPPTVAAPAATGATGAPSFATGDDNGSAPAPVSLAPQHKPSLIPWLLAALALAGATAFLLWRRRPREIYAGAPQFEPFEAAKTIPTATRATGSRPLPPPPLPPAPELPKPQRPASSGIVAAGLRPALEIGIQPLRCVVEDEQVTIEFSLDLFNAGAAPARAVLAEASLLNASATQDQDLSAFFANPVGAGQRIDAIPPMKSVTVTSQVVAPRASMQEYELAGRKAFVPVIAFNALYEWAGGKAQTSAAYLLGRETSSDKLGPLRLDAGPRDFRGLGARPLPTALRT